MDILAVAHRQGEQVVRLRDVQVALRVVVTLVVVPRRLHMQHLADQLDMGLRAAVDILAGAVVARIRLRAAATPRLLDIRLRKGAVVAVVTTSNPNLTGSMSQR